jgi:hypothetical protein
MVLKFFIDRAGTKEGDIALASAMRQTSVILQARLDDKEPHPNDLPNRFKLGVVREGDGRMLGADSGWLPLPQMADAAHDIGFIDHVTLDRMALVERYRDHYVKSLYTCAIEMALGERARITPGKSIEFGAAKLKLDEHSEAAIRYPAKDGLQYLSFIDLLDGPVRSDLAGRVVIIGWDASRFEVVQTPAGPIRPHRAFCYALLWLYEQLQ